MMQANYYNFLLQILQKADLVIMPCKVYCTCIKSIYNKYSRGYIKKIKVLSNKKCSAKQLEKITSTMQCNILQLQIKYQIIS